MSDMVLSIRLTADGKGLVGEVRGSAEELKKLGQAARESNQQGATSAELFTGKLKDQAATLGKTRSETLAYEASQQKLSSAQKESVAQSLKAIDAHEKNQMVLGRVKLAAVGAATALTAMAVGALKSSITEAAAAEQAHLKLEAVLRATGFAAGLSKTQLDAMAESMKRTTGFDDDAVRNSMAVMLSFKQVTGETFGQAMEMAANLSKLLGQDLQSSVLMLGKALENPDEGLAALSRAGVRFNDSQKDTIKLLVDTGRQAQALTLILQLLREKGLDNLAASMNTGYTGAMNKAMLATSDFLKMIGNFPVVKEPVVATFSAWGEQLDRIRNIIENGTWVQKFLLLQNPTLALATAYATPKPDEREYVGGREGVLVSQARQRQAMEQARDQVKQLMKDLRTDEQKLEDEVKKFRELAKTAALTPGETATGVRAIRRGYDEPRDLATLQQIVAGDEESRQQAAEASSFVADMEKRLRERQHYENMFEGQDLTNKTTEDLQQMHDGWVQVIDTMQEADIRQGQINAGFDGMGNEIKKATTELDDMKFAIEGWGLDVSKSLGKAAIDGKISLETLGNAVKDLGAQLIAIQIQRRIMEPILKGATTWLDTMFVGSGGGAGTDASGAAMNANLAHSGGIVGALAGRTIHPAYFENAPRLHGGGIAGDEVPVIARRGEGVFTPQQMRAMGPQSVRVEIVNSGTEKEVESATPRIDVDGMVVRVVQRDVQVNGPISQTLSRTFGMQRRMG